MDAEPHTWRTPDGERLFTEQDLYERACAITAAAVVGACTAFFGYLVWDRTKPVEPPPGFAEFYSTAYSATPPIEFTGGAEVRVRFTTREEIRAICGPNAGACFDTVQARIVAPNPCYDGHENEGRRHEWRAEYQRVLCHELGHVQGWRHSAPQPDPQR